MKTLTLILTTGFLLLSFFSYSQVKSNLKTSHPHPKPLEVRKGYYSIGNNAEKLGRSSSIEIANVDSYEAIQKGYYAIGNNHRKLGKRLVIELDSKPALPVTSKGYFSIGRNDEKLKQ